jgi:hypothetical protein
MAARHGRALRGARPPLPAIPGAEWLGGAVEDLREGELVIPLDREVIKVPAGVDPLQLAMLKVTPPTAYLTG